MNHHPRVAVASKRQIPLALSLLSAGDAAEISEDYELLDVNELITKGREGFAAFIVTGDSMVDEIRPGFIVFIDSWAEPKNGDIVVSCVNGRNNVKIFEHSNRGLYLVPVNGKHPTREITRADSFHIVGVVKGHLALY